MLGIKILWLGYLDFYGRTKQIRLLVGCLDNGIIGV